MTNLYDKYYSILKHVYKIMKLTDKEETKELSKKTILDIVNQLKEKDKNNAHLYNGILEEFGLEITTDKEVGDTKEESLISEKDDVKEPIELEEVSKETDDNVIEEDLKKESIQSEINIDESNSQENINTDESKEKEYQNVEEYVMDKIYRNDNQKIGDEFQKIMIDLINNLRNNDEENIIISKNKYDKFVKDYESILDKEKMDEYYQQRYNEYKGENLSEKENTKEEGLKIKSIKKTYNSKLKNRALALLALAGIGKFNPLLATGIGVGAYWLYKRGIKNARSLIEKNGLSVDTNNNLIDATGAIIREEDIGKIKYNLVKKELSKITNSGRIDFGYKKNKLTSMLLNLPIIKNINNKYQQIKANKDKDSIEIEEMNKGMGILK